VQSISTHIELVTPMSKFNPVLSVAGRIMIALLFILSGYSKFVSIEGTQGYMMSVGLPGFLIYPTILLEIGGGLAIIAGYQTRLIALVFAAYCLLSGFLFHSNFSDQMQFIMFLKNIAIAGGFLFLVRDGAGALSIDNRGA
jgi:putative oxidoreductase